MPSHQDSIGSYLARQFRKRADAVAPETTDLDRVRGYKNDPIGFCRDVLGFEPWSKQADWLRAVTTHKRIAVASGHKTGKSRGLAALAWWFYCTHPGARVVITSVTDRQVNGIVWREIRRLARSSKIPLPGAAGMNLRAQSGIEDPSFDFAEIKGYTAREVEAIAGTSGPAILYLVDEASGVSPEIFEAIEGNRAAGNAWLVMISNPTRAEGEFYDSFHSKRDLYATFRIDSRDSPNITGECYDLWGCEMPGLAVSSWVEEKAREWGEDSAMFKIRVAGLFSVAEDAKIFPSGLLIEAQSRWETADDSGRLFIGIDPAGPGDGGDESAFVPRRGKKALWPRTKVGLSAEAHVAEALDLIHEHREPIDNDEPPIAVLDIEGPIGARALSAFREHADRRPRDFEIAAVRASDRAVRSPHLYDRMRDELWANGREWLRDGGALPEHGKLAGDLHAAEFKSNLAGRLKVTPKRDLRKLLGRSPDVGDAFLLSCWEPLSLRLKMEAAHRAPAASVYEEAARVTMDPYAAVDVWGTPSED
jgi:hypothetical protein